MSEEIKETLNEAEADVVCECGGCCSGKENQKHDVNEKDEKKKKKHDKELNKIKDEASKISDELVETKDRLLRAVAEFDNYRKRTEREKAASFGLGTANAVEKLLMVLDTLELAADAETADEQYKKGVIMTLTMFRDSILSLGVEEIASIGVEFNPSYHCAVAREPSEELESGTIVNVLRKGYKLGERIIRPTMVTVAE